MQSRGFYALSALGAEVDLGTFKFSFTQLGHEYDSWFPLTVNWVIRWLPREYEAR